MSSELTKGLLGAFVVQHCKAQPPDTTVTLGPYEWRLHSEVLIKSSVLFKAALSNPWQVCCVAFSVIQS